MRYFSLILSSLVSLFFLYKAVFNGGLGNDVLFLFFLLQITTIFLVFKFKEKISFKLFSVFLFVLSFALHASGMVCQGKGKSGCQPLFGINYFIFSVEVDNRDAEIRALREQQTPNGQLPR